MNVKELHVDTYVHKLLTNKQFMHKEYRKYVKNGYTIQNLTGNVSPSALYELIKRAKWSRKYQGLLADILFYADKESITNYNFELLTKFGKRRRLTYLSAITHANLSFYQMSMINKISGEFEAFAWLFDRICCNDIFSEEDMGYLLRDNKSVTTYGIQACIESAIQMHGDQKKIDVAVAWLREKEH